MKIVLKILQISHVVSKCIKERCKSAMLHSVKINLLLVFSCIFLSLLSFSKRDLLLSINFLMHTQRVWVSMENSTTNLPIDSYQLSFLFIDYLLLTYISLYRLFPSFLSTISKSSVEARRGVSLLYP